MKFIKLSNDFMKSLVVNIDVVASMWRENGDTCIKYTSGFIDWVKETPEEIMEMINGTVENTPKTTDEKLREMMKSPKYWKEQDPEFVKKVENGFKKLYGDK